MNKYAQAVPLRHATERPAVARDNLLHRSGVVLKQCAPDGPDSLAGLVHRHKSQPSRWMNGLAPNPASDALEFMTQLSRGETTTPYPLLAELKVVAFRGQIEERTTEFLVKRWHEMQERECIAEAAENLAGLRRKHNREGWRQAHKEEAAIQLELVAIDEELERRGVDPEDFRGDGLRLV